MTAAIEVKPIDCPHCKGKIDVEIERKPAPKVHIEKQEDPTMPVSELESFVEKAIAKREASKPEAPKQEKPKTKIAAHIPKYRCKDCDKLHDNPDFEGLAKGKCDTCGGIFTKKSKGKCPYCKEGEIEALDESDIESMGLYTEEMEEEEHGEH